MIIGVTETDEFKRCRLRWNFGSRNAQGLEKIVPSPPLALGTMLHAGLADWLTNPNLRLRDLFLYRAKQMIDEASRLFAERNGRPATDSDIGALLESVNMGAAMMENYQEHWKTPLPPGFELVQPEQRVQVPIPGTEHYLEGRLDAIIREVSDKRRLYVLEHKSYSSRPSEKFLRFNHQFISYHWMLTQLGLGPVAGVAYDGMWKRAAPPKLVDGKPGTLPDLFMRIKIEHTKHELRQYERNLAVLSNEMASRPFIYPHRQWDGSCEWSCEFSLPCEVFLLGEDLEVILQRAYKKKDPDTALTEAE